MEDYRRSGQIPPFGNWDYVNQLPITQCFECARHAGLFRYSSSSGDSGDLYATETFIKPSRPNVHPRRTRGKERKGGNAKEQRKQVRVCDVAEPQRKQHLQAHGLSHKTVLHGHHRHHPPPRPRLPKAVDEDLYKIPPELLRTSNRKRMMGFFSRCLAPACAS